MASRKHKPKPAFTMDQIGEILDVSKLAPKPKAQLAIILQQQNRFRLVNWAKRFLNSEEIRATRALTERGS